MNRYQITLASERHITVECPQGMGELLSEIEKSWKKHEPLHLDLTDGTHAEELINPSYIVSIHEMAHTLV